MKPLVRIATRKSPLALWQAEHVAARLRETHPGLVTELLPMSTRGDKLLDAPLAKVGGKGLFVKELEHCLLNGQADIAVHSMKDVPVALPPELQIGVIMAREDPSDALVSRRFTCLDELPQDAVLGTSSLRRQCQLRARLPACRYIELRGNVNTRLAKLDNGECDALVLASAGLKRLGLASAITESLPFELSLPAIGQGALGIEYRRDDHATDELVRPLADVGTTIAITAERAMNERLQGGCQVPIAGHAEWAGPRLRLRGLVALPDGSRILRAEDYAEPARARELGIEIADRLLDQGAGAILAALGAS